MTWTEDLVYKLRGINPQAKKAYTALFNSKGNKEKSIKVIEDLIMRFHFYGAKPTADPLMLARQAGHREVIEYILTMAARISSDTLQDIESLINRGGNNDD